MVETTNKGQGVFSVPKAKQTVCHRGIVSSQNPAFHLAIKVDYFVGHKKVPSREGEHYGTNPTENHCLLKFKRKKIEIILLSFLGGWGN